MVLVHVQVAVDLDLQLEAAVLADLLEHVVVEGQTGVDLRLGGAVQVQLDPDPGFLGVALDQRPARCVGQFVGDPGPVPLAAELRGAQLEGADAQVGGELVVGGAVADHRRALPVHRAVVHVGQGQADGRLAGGAVLVREAAIDQDLAEHDALAFEQLHHQLVRAVEAGLRIGVGAQAVLVGHHHELPAGVAQPQQGRHYPAHEAQFFVGIDLEVLRLLDQGAIAIDEQDRPVDGSIHAAASFASSAASTRWFCSGVPMLMRRASPSCGAARWSRTTTPAASRRAKAASASAKRTSR